MAPADEALTRDYPGDSGARQPVHTLYQPADRVGPGVVVRRAARAALDEHAPDPATLAEIVGGDPVQVAEVWPLLLAKLESDPVEDLRIDLEDGYRGHSDDEEDAHAVAAVRAVAAAPALLLGRAVQVLRGTHPGTRVCAPSTWCVGAALESGPLPDGLPAHAAEGDLGRAGAGHGPRRARASRRRTRWRPDGCGSRCRSRRRRRCSGPTAPRPWPGSCTRRRDASTGCTSAPTTTPRRSASPPRTRRWTTPSPTTPRTCCCLRRRAPAYPSPTARPTSCPSAPRSRSRAGWALHFRLVRRSLERGLLPGLGPASGPAADPVPGHVPVLPRGPRPGRRAGCAATSAAPSGPSRTSRPRHRRWPGSSGVGCSAARSTPDEITDVTGCSVSSVDDLALRRG